MKQGSYLLRFVDVVLILLFGFIVISDIEEESLIDLPTTTEIEISAPDIETVTYIGITRTGILFDERNDVRFRSLEDLREYLQARKNRYGADGYKVRIRANYDTPTSYVIPVADLCDELEIIKSIDVEITSSNG